MTTTSISYRTEGTYSIETDTVTIFSATVTWYAACATNNILGPQVSAGTYVQGLNQADPNFQLVNVEASSPYDCCAKCASGSVLSNCEMTQYYAGSGECYVTGRSDAGWCPNGTQANAGIVHYSDTVQDYYFSNGPCGYLTGGGAQ